MCLSAHRGQIYSNSFKDGKRIKALWPKARIQAPLVFFKLHNPFKPWFTIQQQPLLYVELLEQNFKHLQSDITVVSYKLCLCLIYV